MAVKPPDWRLVSGAFTGGSSGSARPFEEVPIGTLDGVNTIFKLSFTPWLGFLQLYINGNLQSKFVPRFSLSGNIITFYVAPRSTDEIYCWYFKGPASGTLPGPGQARGFGTVGVSAGDKLDWGASTLYQLQASMSFGAWVQLSSSSDTGRIVFRGRSDTSFTPENNECFSLDAKASAGKMDLSYYHQYGADLTDTLDFSAQLNPGDWYYVGFSRDSVAQTVTAYKNPKGGALTAISTQSYGNNPDGGGGPLNRLVIGNWTSDGSPPNANMNGAVAEHYLWNRAISLAEHSAASAASPPTSGLILACSMGNNPEVDSSGNGGSGTVTGTVFVDTH